MRSRREPIARLCLKLSKKNSPHERMIDTGTSVGSPRRVFADECSTSGKNREVISQSKPDSFSSAALSSVPQGAGSRAKPKHPAKGQYGIARKTQRALPEKWGV